MSASREKKQRRTSDASLLSPRAQEEQKKAAHRKRNTIVYTVVGAVVVILVAALLIWDSGIFQRSRTVATIDGQKVTAPQILYYYNNNTILYYAQSYAQLGMSFPYSTDTSPKEQVITEDAAEELGLDEEYVGKTYHEYFLDNAIDTLRRQYAVLNAAKEAGYSLSDAGKESVKQSMAALDSNRASYLAASGINLSRTGYLQQLYGDLMSESAYRSILEKETLAEEYYDLAFDTLTARSDEDLDSYYQEHKDTLDDISYYWREFEGTAESTVDEDGNTIEPTEEEQEAALAAAKEEADDALAEVLDDPDLVKDNEDYQFASGILSNTSSFYYDWLVNPARRTGDATVFEGDYNSYYLVVFGDRYRNEEPYSADIRQILISAAAEDDPETEDVDESAEVPTDEAYEAAKAEAERILEEWNAGEATEDSFAALAEQYSADAATSANGGLNTGVTNGRIASCNDWIFDSSRQSGDVSDPIQNTETGAEGWYLLYFKETSEPQWKLIALSALWNDFVKDTMEVSLTDYVEALFD